MSLFIGNLSPRIHRDELEHVFRRFGRCSVQLKDGYGFAVYEFPPNAEKALTALRGKNICGEPIILSWSNKQPRPFRRFARGDGFYEPPYGRKTTRGGYFERRLISNGRRDFKMGMRHPYTEDRRRLNSTGIVDEEMNHNQSKLNDYIEEGHSDVAIEGGSDAPIQVDNDRWVQEVGEPSYDNEAANGMEFDRYDPYHSHEKRDEDASDLNVYSPTLGNSQEKTGKDKARMLILNGQDNPRREQTCYSCGEVGHKMRNCPREGASWRRRFSKFDYRREDEHNYKERSHFEPDGPWPSVPGDRRPSCGDSVLMRRPSNYKEASDSGKRRRLMRSGHSLATSEALKKYKPKKRSRGEDGTLRKPHPRKARSASSPLHSDCPASSRSQSSKSLSRSSSHLRSRSASSRSRSLSANSRSSSIFLPSKNSKSRSKSSSMPLSLSVSLSQPLPSSPNKAQINPRGSLIKAMTPESREVLAEKEKSVDANTGSQNTKLGSAMLMVKTGNGMSSDEAVDDFNGISVHQRDADDNHAASRVMLNGVTDPSLCMFEKGAFLSSSSPTQSVSGKDEHGGPKEWASVTKLHSEVPLNLCPHNSIKISLEEMDMIMKHYGMEQSGKNDLFIEDYFGSARLWPWEIVYYRRLRKGPISVENYAQRIVQNQEFGIVDKYVRSSSGWGELGPDIH